MKQIKKIEKIYWKSAKIFPLFYSNSKIILRMSQFVVAVLAATFLTFRRIFRVVSRESNLKIFFAMMKILAHFLLFVRSFDFHAHISVFRDEKVEISWFRYQITLQRTYAKRRLDSISMPNVVISMQCGRFSCQLQRGKKKVELEMDENLQVFISFNCCSSSRIGNWVAQVARTQKLVSESVHVEFQVSDASSTRQYSSEQARWHHERKVEENFEVEEKNFKFTSLALVWSEQIISAECVGRTRSLTFFSAGKILKFFRFSSRKIIFSLLTWHLFRGSHSESIGCVNSEEK